MSTCENQPGNRWTTSLEPPGSGAGTLHRHFPTKEGLLGEVVVHRVPPLADHIGELANAQNAVDAVTTAMTLMLDEGDRSAVLKASLLGSDLDLRTPAPDAVNQLRSAVGQLLTRVQQAHEIRTDTTPTTSCHSLPGRSWPNNTPVSAPTDDAWHRTLRRSPSKTDHRANHQRIVTGTASFSAERFPNGTDE